jgi:molybdenum cofactor guanylyltransferase
MKGAPESRAAAGATPAPDAGADVRHDACAVLLAGGRGLRMGADKALLDIHGKPLIERLVDVFSQTFDEVIVSAADAGSYPFLKVPVIPDSILNAGPLGGILSGLSAARHDICFVVACDIPEADPLLVARLLEHLRDHDAAVPRYPNGHIEPLFAVYRKSLLPSIRRVLDAGGRKIRDIYRDAKVLYLELGPNEKIVNLNTPEDFRAYLEVSGSSV